MGKKRSGTSSKSTPGEDSINPPSESTDEEVDHKMNQDIEDKDEISIEPPSDPYEALLERHRGEIRALKNEVTRLKKAVSKGDKKRKKDTQARIAIMESELYNRQEKELSDFRKANPSVSHL